MGSARGEGGWGGGSWSLGSEDVKCEAEVTEQGVCQGDSHPGSWRDQESAGEVCFRGCSRRNARSIREWLAAGKTTPGLLSCPHGALDMVRTWGCLGVPGEEVDSPGRTCWIWREVQGCRRLHYGPLERVRKSIWKQQVSQAKSHCEAAFNSGHVMSSVGPAELGGMEASRRSSEA